VRLVALVLPPPGPVFHHDPERPRVLGLRPRVRRSR